MNSDPLVTAYITVQALRKELEHPVPNLTVCRKLVYTLDETCSSHLSTLAIAPTIKTKLRHITSITTTEYAIKNIEEVGTQLTTLQLRILYSAVDGTSLEEMIKAVRNHRSYETVGADIIGRQLAQLKERELVVVQDVTEEEFESYKKALATRRAGTKSPTPRAKRNKVGKVG